MKGDIDFPLYGYRRQSQYLFHLGLEAGGALPHVRALDAEDFGVLHGVVRYRVGAQSRVDPRAPLVWLEPQGEFRRVAAIARFRGLEEVDRVERVPDRCGEEATDDGRVRFREPAVRSAGSTIAPRRVNLAHVVEPRAARRHGVPASRGAWRSRDAVLAAPAPGHNRGVLPRPVRAQNTGPVIRPRVGWR